MELNEKDYKILEEIARRPQLTKEQLAEETGISENSVGQRIYKFREHGLVVTNTGSGAVKKQRHTGKTYTEPYENDEFEWLITGKGEQKLRERKQELQKRTRELKQSFRRRKVYRPRHVLD